MSALFVAAPAAALDNNAVAPPFSLRGQGAAVTLNQFRGQLVYLDFWASWCGPCKQSFPFMNAMQRKYSSSGLRVVAVNLDETAGEAERFLRAVPAEFTIAFDSEGMSPKLYAIKGMPSSVLIGRDGKIISIHQGFKKTDEVVLERAIVAALGSGT